MHLAILANAAATIFMTGLIWFVQVVHYPLFASVGTREFAGYAIAHQRLTTLVVGPAMLVEAITALLFVAARPAAIPAWLAWTGLGLVGAIWLSTFALQVPAHEKLSSGFDPGTGAFLVATNWIRTAAWSARSLLVLAGIFLLLGPDRASGSLRPDGMP